jgi:outer membrane protein assembly factor BamD (BamD/ComL family)
MSPGVLAGSERVRGSAAPLETTPADSELQNRTITEHLRFWDHISVAGIQVEPPAETFTLRPDGLKPVAVPQAGTYSGLLAGAQELFRQGRHAEAGKLYRYLADRERIPPQIAEEARYYQAECYRLQGYYPDAADTYVGLLNKFPTTLYREQAVQHLYDIANYWLDDTRERMKEVKEWREGKRWWVSPRFFNLDRTKPFMDREGHALKHLEQVRFNDINGPLADKALFLCGSVKYFNENYQEADYFFTQIHERHPNSPLAPQAIELAIVSKHMSTGGSDYDGRKAAEARKLIDSALTNYPELKEKREILERQRAVITFQQAEKDFKQADFYQRQGKLGAAYFYFEMVKNSYPGTPYAEKSIERIEQIRVEVEKRGGTLTPAPASAGANGPIGTPGLDPLPGGGPEQAPPPRRN